MTRTLLPCVAVAAGLIILLGCVCDPCIQARKNKELVADAFEVLQSGEFDTLDAYIAEDYVRHCQATPEVQVTTLAAFKEYLVQNHSVVPDETIVVHRLVAEDDLVSFWMTYSGTQQGPMGPYPATGKRMELDIAGMHRIADGKIVETWVTWDNLTALTQLGLFPPQPADATE